MLFIVHSDPQFIVNKEMTLQTSKGILHLDAGDSIGINKSEDGRMFLGVELDEDCDVLEFDSKRTGIELLESCVPAAFELGLDEDGDSYIKSTFLEEKSTLNEKISKITLTEDIPSKTLIVTKIQ